MVARLQADTGYIEQIDIDEMSELVGDLQADKKYYQANIALATSSLAAKTTALIAQVATATASSGTYGFNAGIELAVAVATWAIRAVVLAARLDVARAILAW